MIEIRCAGVSVPIRPARTTSRRTVRLIPQQCGKPVPWSTWASPDQYVVLVALPFRPMIG
ncbi:hypothetical protein [Saccharopolyspora sp. CA-218241]|uniref:hypothetical protein n=1 Tax=Saccharopolyspora sp. CA-218241 TaxID=3240027 RepID=UPI003D97BB85